MKPARTLYFTFLLLKFGIGIIFNIIGFELLCKSAGENKIKYMLLEFN